MGNKALNNPSPADTGVSARAAVEVGNGPEKGGSIGTAVADSGLSIRKAGGTSQWTRALRASAFQSMTVSWQLGQTNSVSFVVWSLYDIRVPQLVQSIIIVYILLWHINFLLIIVGPGGTRPNTAELCYLVAWFCADILSVAVAPPLHGAPERGRAQILSAQSRTNGWRRLRPTVPHRVDFRVCAIVLDI